MKRGIAFLLSCLLAVSMLLVGCGAKTDGTTKSTGEDVIADSTTNEVQKTKVRVGSLKVPTSIGLVSLM